MDPRTATGFLGTDASLASDIALLAYVLLIVPGMLLGFYFARRKTFFSHQITMTTIVIVNWIIILYLMLHSFLGSVAPDIPAKLNQPFYTLPSVHLLFGGTAQILGTLLVIQMWFGPHVPYRIEPIKRWMRLTLSLWLITAVLGIATYVTWYGVPFRGHSTTPPGGVIATQQATESAP